MTFLCFQLIGWILHFLYLRKTKMNVSTPDSLPTTLDGYPLVSQLTGETLGESLLSASIPVKEDPNSPSVSQSYTPDGFSTPQSAAARDNYSSVLCDSGRGAQEEDTEQPSSYKSSDILYYSTGNWSSTCSSQWSSHSSEHLSSSEEWRSWSLSSSGHSKEEWDSGFTNEATLLPSEDTRVPSTNTFSFSTIVPSMVGAGLANLGNTCFINAILQCFAHTVPLILGLSSCSHSVPCDYDIHGFCVLCGLRDYIEQSLMASGRVISPLNFVANLNHFSFCFSSDQQEDAHEFMHCVLDKLNRCFVDLKKKNQSIEQDGNLVEKVFGGCLISKVELKYDLYAIVVHTGFSSTSGYYFCFVRSAPDTWHRLDDSVVSRVHGDYVLSQEAYLLFYTKQGTPWFSSIMEASQLCLDSSIPKSVLATFDNMCNSHPNVKNIISGSDNKKFPEELSDYSPEGRSEALEVDDIVDASCGPGQFPSRLNHEDAGFNGSRDDTTHTQMPCRSSVISNGNSCNERNGTLSSPDLSNCCLEVVNIRENDGFCYIPRDHLKMENHESCKRPFNKSLEDSKRKEVIKYATKSMPVSRRRKLLDSMMGPHGEGSSNRRRKVMDLSLCKKDCSPRVGRKSNHGSVMHDPVMA